MTRMAVGRIGSLETLRHTVRFNSSGTSQGTEGSVGAATHESGILVTTTLLNAYHEVVLTSCHWHDHVVGSDQP